MQIVVASYNPVKLQAVANAFTLMFPGTIFTHTPTSVLSEVSKQPLTDSQTKKGAINRVTNAKKLFPNAQFWVGLEGGVHLRKDSVSSFAWVAISNQKLTNTTRTATFNLPISVAKLLKDGLELGDAMDHLHQRTNSKQQEGAVGILTQGVISRSQLYQQALVCCLIPFLKKH
ncbi:inosine/xanthosine triphosphatase [Pseudomonadota bacterium]